MKLVIICILSILLYACKSQFKGVQNITNIAGIYIAKNNDKDYHLIITVVSDSDNQEFLIFGFNEDKEALFMQQFNTIITSNMDSAKANVCSIMQNKFCDKEIRKSQGICSAQTIYLPLNIYLESPGKYGIFMFSNLKNKYLFGDKYDVIKGNFLLPAKEYVVSGLTLNNKGELSSLDFKETGFIQAFTSETLTFKKIKNIHQAWQNKVNSYAKIKQDLQSLVKNNAQDFFNSCGL
ncbi:MAG: hypothetical protein HFP77_10030 [Methylococcales symbiont of Iophon sp. n. MRB-2018]|nr:MAG: hypothetical protein HFP77_10030 [Methylococcales symbiont of Iophon sp. n. MRB-2018]KAF3979062.1 MAG: hypothetical protein HFP76_09040 [Methylococcales symbiont of Iophon sp. n. MRB-2018]